MPSSSGSRPGFPGPLASGVLLLSVGRIVPAGEDTGGYGQVRTVLLTAGPGVANRNDARPGGGRGGAGPRGLEERMPEKRSCEWPSDDPLMIAYHDREWGTPVHDDRKQFEFLILEGAQAGLSWRTVLHKREAYRAAFAGFDPRKVARFGARDVRRLLSNAGIIRNRLKIGAAIKNARAFLVVQEEFGTFDAYIWRFVDGKPKVNRWRSIREI